MEPISKSAASWSAIIVGTFIATAVAVVLFALGSGLGFALISPWNDQGIAITAFAATLAIWLIVIQWLSSAAGGYLAGRLRMRRIGTLAVATVLVAMVLCLSLTSVIGAGVHAAEHLAERAATAATMDSAQRLAVAATPSAIEAPQR